MSAVRRAIVSAAVAACGPGLIAACAVYDPSLLSTGASDAGIEAARDASGPNLDGAVEASDGCQHALPPPRPSISDLDGGTIAFTMALSNVDLGLDAGTALSYDLDRTCTCPAAESCVPATGAPPHCDGDGGRDNAAGALFSKFALISAGIFDSANMTKRISQGDVGMVLQVSGYNGLADDSRVELSVYISDGIAPGTSHPAPAHDGSDVWSVDDSSVLGGLAAKPPFKSLFVDSNAYVAGGALVGSLDFPFALGGAQGLSLDLKGGLITGRLQKSGAGYGLTEGRMAGRWSSRAVLTAMQYIPDPIVANQWLCGSDLTYQALRGEICKAADLTADLQNDNTSARCDALSIGIGFTSEAAAVGNVFQATPKAHPCGVTYTDQCGQ